MRDEASAGVPPGDDLEWEGRRLCPDGACVGVVNRDGVCGTCGKVDPDYDASAAARGNKGGNAGEEDEGDDEGDEDEGDDGEGDDESDGGDDEAAAGGEGDDWQRRKLCDDGACIGVVVEGRCNTCGRAG